MTGKELAEKLHISPSSVSLALNGKPGISNSLRNRILAAAAQEGVVQQNRNIKTPNRTIRFIIYINKGMVVREISFHAFVLQGIEKAAKTLGYNILVSYLNQEGDLETQTKNILCDVDGIIFLATEFHMNQTNHNLIKKISSHCPMILLDNSAYQCNIDSVSTDNFQGGYQALSHLVSLGHTKIAYLWSKQRIDNFDERLSGVQQEAANHPLVSVTLIPISFNVKKAVQELCDWINTHADNLPTACMCDSDIIALGAIQAFHICGLSIPGDVSIIGFDDMPACEMSTPPLDSIHVQKKEMGRIGLLLLDQRINETSGVPSLELPHSHIRLTTKPIIRKSSTCIDNSY